MLTCNMCKDTNPEAEPFQAPYDPIGIALMHQHLESEHGVKNGF